MPLIKPKTVHITAELNERQTRIILSFPYDWELVRTVKTLPEPKFHSDTKSWSIHADLDNARLLREKFGDKLQLGPNLREWGHQRNKLEDKLTTLALADTAELEHLPTLNPELYEAIYCGPQGKNWSRKERQQWMAKNKPSYQSADTKFMADHPDGCCNFNQPGTGKTLELMAAAEEGGYTGPKLVVAPLTSLDSVWQPHLEFWQKQPVIVPLGHKLDKQAELSRMELYMSQGRGFWVVVNPQMLTLRRNRAIEAGRDDDFWEPFPELYSVPWDLVVVDEFHKMGLGNTQSNTYKGLIRLDSKKNIPTSGTPFGGKPEKLYGILHFANNRDFSNKWRFFAQWFELHEVDYGRGRVNREVGRLREDREEAFAQMLSRHAVRRTKDECMPWLPPKLYADTIWADMDDFPGQAKQYKQFALETEIKIEDEQLSATSILAEYTRLKQFSDAKQRIMGYQPSGTAILKPLRESCKLPHMMEILGERGINPTSEGGCEGNEQVLIFSQFTEIVDMVHDYLVEGGIPTARITGKINKKGQRKDIINRFQAGEYRVVVMNTNAGGVSVTLDNANTVIFLDETWNPDDQEQAEDRCHRGDKTQRVTVYYIKSKGTIEEYIEQRVDEKDQINKKILDLRRKGLKAIED